MAQNLSFSIANILRSDFPPPSHIRHVPRCIYLERLNDSRNLPYVALRCQLDRRASFCNETEFFARNYYSAHTLSVISEKDAKIQNSGCVREQQRKKGMWSLFFFLNTLSTVQFEFISPHSLQQLAPKGTYVEKRGKFFTPNKTLEISGSEVFKVSEWKMLVLLIF